MLRAAVHCLSFFSNDTPTTEIYTLSLHDALPILSCSPASRATVSKARTTSPSRTGEPAGSRTPGSVSGKESTLVDRKSTRLNSSHLGISYAVFCLKKKKQIKNAVSIDKYEECIEH